MEWIIENWILVLVIGGMAAMHLFGHGHGRHKHGKAAKRQTAQKKVPDAPADTRVPSEDA
ncbi:hypothetical protein [Salipiger marinus]|jgi:hypothetical protein|uniref:DUF2933 domain-containing protein n=1 Tax=Salipiger marinus TaxID=555512 RepID=A0A1G8U1A7_9RHOB|nr:hypothetical protein [Salipiger marinus]SDJ46790.1 hypothetical protein SAMN04487993_103417 [Salipiger marinus]